MRCESCDGTGRVPAGHDLDPNDRWATCSVCGGDGIEETVCQVDRETAHHGPKEPAAVRAFVKDWDDGRIAREIFVCGACIGTLALANRIVGTVKPIGAES